MAIYHCSIKNIGRSDGRSAVACSAYRAAQKLRDKETGCYKLITCYRAYIFFRV